MNEVREVLDDIVHKLESQSTLKLLKEVRNEVKTVRDKLLKAHDEIARLEDENSKLVRQRRDDKLEARILKNRLQVELGEILNRLDEGQKYKEEVQSLKEKLKRKDKWLKSLNYNTPNSAITNSSSSIKASRPMQSKERRRSSYGRLQVISKLHVDNTTRDSKQNAQRRLVFNNSGSENDKVEIYNLKHKPQDVASIQYIAEDLQLFSKVLEFLTVQDNCRLACAGRKIVPEDFKAILSAKTMADEEKSNLSSSKYIETKTLLPPPPSYHESTKPAETPPPSYFSGVGSEYFKSTRGRSKTVNTMLGKVVGAKSEAFAEDNILSKMKSLTLSNQDMRVIISIQKRLDMAQKKVSLLTSEREDLLTQLKAKSSVKDFLVNKMKTKERELIKAKEEETLAKQQSNADREVIAFLDGRVRELEDSVTDRGKVNEKLQNEVNQLKQKMENQRRLFEDMINNVKQQTGVEIAKLRNEKKILVKEIKRMHGMAKST